MRNLCSRFLVAAVLALLSISMGGLSGCGADKSDGMIEEPEIDVNQKTEVKAQYQKQMQERQSKSGKKGKSGRPENRARLASSACP